MKQALLNVLLLGMSLVIGLAVFEFALSRFYDSEVDVVEDKEFDATLGWRLKPGVRWVKPPHAFAKHEVYVNQYGMRSGEIARSIESGTQRILVLGDSFAFGEAVPDSHTFPRVLEARLNDDHGQPSEVLNAAVPAYGSAQELLLMRALHREGIAADVYLLAIFHNDILDNLRLSYQDLSVNRVAPLLRISDHGELAMAELPERKPAEFSPNFVMPSSGFQLPRTIQVLWLTIESFVQTRPALVGLANRLGVEIDFPYVPTIVQGWYNEEVLREGVPLLRAILEAARDEATQHNGELLVSFVPTTLQVYLGTYSGMLEQSFADHRGVREFLADPAKPERIVGELCAELGLPYLDLLPALREHNDEQLYIPRDGHLSRAGHHHVAESLGGFIANRPER